MKRGRPRIYVTTSKKYPVRFERSTAALVDRRAKRAGLTASQWIRSIILEHIGRR